MTMPPTTATEWENWQTPISNMYYAYLISMNLLLVCVCSGASKRVNIDWCVCVCVAVIVDLSGFHCGKDVRRTGRVQPLKESSIDVVTQRVSRAEGVSWVTAPTKIQLYRWRHNDRKLIRFVHLRIHRKWRNARSWREIKLFIYRE